MALTDKDQADWTATPERSLPAGSVEHIALPVTEHVGAPPAEHVVDLRDVFRAIWNGKWLVLLATLAGLAYGLWNLHKTTPVFEAYMVVMPAGDSSMSSSGAGGTVNKIAQSFGISADDKGTDFFGRLEITIGSYALAERLQNKFGLLQKMHGGQWEEESNSWRRPGGSRFEVREKIRAFFNLPTWMPPSIASLSRYLGSAIMVSDIDLTDVKRISLQHSDLEMAGFILEKTYQEVTELLREQDRDRIERQRAYILSQLKQVRYQDSREVLLQLLTDRERSLMLTEDKGPYLGLVIDPVRLPARPESPNTNKLVVLPTTIAFILSAPLVTLFFLFRSEGR